MVRTYRFTLAIVAVILSTLLGVYWAPWGATLLGGQKEAVKHQTPEQAWERELERMRNEGRQPSREEEEVIKMGYWMSYLTDKVVTEWLKQLDNRWYPPLSPYEPTWPRCWGGISRFLDLDPPPRREGIDENLRPYVIVEGKRGELVNEPTPLPWSGRWGLLWRNESTTKLFEVDTIWFRYIQAIDKEWPITDRASHYEIYGVTRALMVWYAIKHGDDSFFVHGIWIGPRDQAKYEPVEPSILVFRKYNFKCKLEIVSPNIIKLPATDEERDVMEKVARLIETQIIAYSLFGLEKFTILQVKKDKEEFYLPAARISVGNYLMPVRYVVERLAGKRPIYDAEKRQMKAEIQGRQAMIDGELIEAANHWVEIPEEERFVARREALATLLGIQVIQDVRFGQ